MGYVKVINCLSDNLNPAKLNIFGKNNGIVTKKKLPSVNFEDVYFFYNYKHKIILTVTLEKQYNIQYD